MKGSGDEKNMVPRELTKVLFAILLIFYILAKYQMKLLSNFPDFSITHLQQAQNSLTHVVYPTLRRHDHITPNLKVRGH